MDAVRFTHNRYIEIDTVDGEFIIMLPVVPESVHGFYLEVETDDNDKATEIIIQFKKDYQ